MSTQKQDSNPSPTMKLAEILSDLVSLRVCDPTAALALVSARPNASSAPAPAASTPSQTTADEDDEDGKEGVAADPDLQRAKDLVKLHYAVKEGHRRGELEAGLEEARRAVDRAVGGR